MNVKNSNANIVKFRGSVSRVVYQSDDFKVYGIYVDTIKYPQVKLNQYGNVGLSGDMPTLDNGVEYEFEAVEDDKRGNGSYKMISVRRDEPMTIDGIRAFLNEILTRTQTDEIMKNYPDIIERVKQNRLDDVDLSKLHGIGNITFQKIVNKIQDNFYIADLCAEFGNAMSLSAMKKIYDKYGSVDRIKEKLKEEPYSTLTNVSGIGFKTADAIVLQMQKNNIIDFGYDVLTSIDRCLACITYLLTENENEGNTKMDLVELRNQCNDMVPRCVNKFADAVSDKSIYYDRDKRVISLSVTRNIERRIAKTIAEHLYDDDAWECDVSKYENVGEFKLSNEQLNVVKNLCNNKISILNGPAGSGKSYSTKAVISMLDDLSKSYILLAPTGKAAKVLSEFTKRNASTIHRGLGYRPDEGCVYNEEHKLPYDTVIVDEMSMVDVRLFYWLIMAIDFNRTKLLMIGDNAQLPSVGCGNLLHDFMSSKLIPTVTLTKIFRYDDGGLMRVATDIRTGKRYLDSTMKDKATIFGNNKDYVFMDISSTDNSDSIIAKVVAIYKKLLESGNKIEDVQVLTAKNVGKYGTIVLNNMLQKIANPNADGKSMSMKVGDIKYYVGDLVIQCKNDYRAPLSSGYKYNGQNHYSTETMPTAFVANGETGIVKNVGFGFMDVAFGDIVVRYDNAKARNITLGYAITCHKSQGESINNVILLTPNSDIFMLNSNLVYVGVTRTRNRCYHIGTIRTMDIVLKKKENMSRHTFMQELLKECVDNMNN